MNRKQLEARISLPSEFSGFEVNARKLIGEYVCRGSVQLRVSFDGGGAAEEVTIDRGLLASLVKVCLEERHDIGLDGNVAVEELMRVPGVVGGSTPDMDRPGLAAAFEQAVREALTHHREMREREGEALKKDFQERLARLLLELIQKSERRLGTGEIARYDYISCQHLYLFFYVSVPAPYIPERLCDEM